MVGTWSASDPSCGVMVVVIVSMQGNCWWLQASAADITQNGKPCLIIPFRLNGPACQTSDAHLRSFCVALSNDTS
jgi:hypothetical protein